MTQTIIYTIPKTGTHLISNILCLILKPETNIYERDELYAVVPHRQCLTTDEYFSTHDGYVPLQKLNHNSNFIFSIRNPIDCCISKYFFHNEIEPNIELMFLHTRNTLKYVCDDMFEIVDFFDHHKNIKSLFMKYEDIVSDFESAIQKISDFVDKRISNTEIQSIKEKINIKKFQEKEKVKRYIISPIQKNNFYRNGSIDQYKEYFRPDQILSLCEIISEHPLCKFYPHLQLQQKT